jgi:hypothetical protein
VFFFAYDDDESGTIELNELQILKDQLYERAESSKKQVAELLQHLQDGDGRISREHFITVGLKEPLLLRLLIPEDLLNIQWSCVFKSINQSDRLNTATRELFVLLKQNTDEKRAKALISEG